MNSSQRKLIIFYDPDCGFCKTACTAIKKYLFLQHVEISVITEDTHAMNIFQDEYSWAVYDGVTGRCYSKSVAWWRLVKASPFSVLFYLSYIPGVIWIGDRVYDAVARSRPKTCAA